MPRSIHLFLEPEDFSDIAATTSSEELMSAIAYLSTWNVTTFPVVTISRDRHDTSDLFAFYTDPDKPGRSYSIGAVWHDDHYGFHS